MAYFRVKGDLEHEALEAAKEHAKAGQGQKDFGEVYDDTESSRSGKARKG